MLQEKSTEILWSGLTEHFERKDGKTYYKCGSKADQPRSKVLEQAKAKLEKAAAGEKKKDLSTADVVASIQDDDIIAAEKALTNAISAGIHEKEAKLLLMKSYECTVILGGTPVSQLEIPHFRGFSREKVADSISSGLYKYLTSA